MWVIVIEVLIWTYQVGTFQYYSPWIFSGAIVLKCTFNRRQTVEAATSFQYYLSPTGVLDWLLLYQIEGFFTKKNLTSPDISHPHESLNANLCCDAFWEALLQTHTNALPYTKKPRIRTYTRPKLNLKRKILFLK